MRYRYVLLFAAALLGMEFFLGRFLGDKPLERAGSGALTIVPGAAETKFESESSSSSVFNNGTALFVSRIVDGDTIELSNGKKVRYIGMDTPEIVDPRKPVQCFGREAARRNKELVEGNAVRLEKDVSEVDKYGRLLRYVYLPAASATGTEIFVNLELIKEGYATAFTYPPDVKHAKEFKSAEIEARNAKRGMWSSCLVKR